MSDDILQKRHYDKIRKVPTSLYVEAAPPDTSHPDPPPGVLQGLYKVNTTPYENSFASRLYGSEGSRIAEKVRLRDWQTRPLWLSLCEEIRLHYLLRQ